MNEKEFVWPTQFCSTCRQDKVAAFHFTPKSKQCRECRDKREKKKAIPSFFIGYMKQWMPRNAKQRKSV